MKIIVAGRLVGILGGHTIGLVFSLNPNGLLQIKVPRDPGFQPQDPHFFEAHTVRIYKISRVNRVTPPSLPQVALEQ